MSKAQGKFDFSVHHPFKDSKFTMLTVQAVLYLCAKFRNFPASGSMAVE